MSSEDKKQNMLIAKVVSKTKKEIRLTLERWQHITENHPELSALMPNLMQSIRSPEVILQGKEGELMAIKKYSESKWIVVVYKEEEKDGFIITAFLTSKIDKFFSIYKKL